MNRWLTVCIALALLAAAWLSGCAAVPAGTRPTAEGGITPTTVDKQQPATPTGREATLIPTPASLAEEATMSPEPMQGAPESICPSEARRVVQLATEDLARRLSVSPDDILLLSVEAVQWPDTSLGCPEPGMMYAQVITPGFMVTLQAEAKTYEYHTDRSSVVVLCDVGGVSGSKDTDATVDDGWPSQPRDEGEVDTSRITPIPPPR